ncbi:MAG: CHAD domain-containing protein [Acidimicrobiales bacterium]
MPSSELEREVKFEVSPDFVLPALDQIAADGVTSHPLPVRELDAQYFDTPDLRLARWGCSVRHRSDQGWCVKIPTGDDGPALARGEVVVEATRERLPEAAVQLVSGFTRSAPLEPIVRLRATRRPTRILDADGSELAELVDDRVIVERPDRPPEEFRMLEIELAGDIDVARVGPIVQGLVDSGATLTRCTKVSRALGGPEGVADEVTIPVVSRYPTAREVAHAAIARSVRQVILNLPGVRLGEDPEDLHQARVGVRRLRSDLRTFGPLLDTDWAAGLRNELRFLGGALGAVRDLDVLLATLAQSVADEPAIDDRQAGPLLAWFEAERTARRRTLMATLDSDRTTRLLDDLVGASLDPRTAPQADDPAEEILPPLASKPWRRLERSVAQLDADSTNEEIHAVRILAKRCRYAADVVGPAAGPQAKRFSKAMARIQDCLGDLNDAVVIGAKLRHAAAADPEIAFVAGQLSGILDYRARHTRTDFWPIWKAGSKKGLRVWW